MMVFSPGRAWATLVLAVLLAACSTGGGSATPVPTTNAPTQAATTATTQAPTQAPTRAPTQAATPEPTATTAAFPRTVIDDEGTSVELDAQPESIVSLSPANTEIVFALGAGDRLKGGTDSDDYPAEAAALPDVVQGITVLTEQIVDLHPDVVLAGGNDFTPSADVERLRQLGLPVVVVYPQTVDEVMTDISLIGTATGFESAADELNSGIQTRVDEVTDAVAELSFPRTFYELGYEPDIYGVAPDSFIADMISLAGADAILTDDPAVFSIPLEQLVAADPEVIVLGDAAYGTCPDGVASRPGWEDMTAVKNGDIRPVYDIIVTRPGPRLGEGLAALALAIHPDAVITPPADLPELCAE
jgi:iron complex transport system substrate-binding protein